MLQIQVMNINHNHLVKIMKIHKNGLLLLVKNNNVMYIEHLSKIKFKILHKLINKKIFFSHKKI